MAERKATFLIVFIKKENTEEAWPANVNSLTQQGGVFITASD